MTREEITARARERRAAIADMYHSGDWTPREVRELNGGISRARLSQILQAAKRDAQRERCARGEHGDIWTGRAFVEEPGGMRSITTTKCLDCDGILMRAEALL